MARSRNIKPGFFTNEDLVELDFGTRLLFIGLWTLADREGYLEDRPKRIKMALFPADDLDVEKCLNELHGKKLILRYEVDGGQFIHVKNFGKHQNPHHKEAPSLIPKPSIAPVQPEASPRQAQCEPDSSRADSLIPDSLNRIPDSHKLSLSEAAPQKSEKPDVEILVDDWQPDHGFINSMEVMLGNAVSSREKFDLVLGKFRVHNRGVQKPESILNMSLINWLLNERDQQPRAKQGSGQSHPQNEPPRLPKPPKPKERTFESFHDSEIYAQNFTAGELRKHMQTGETPDACMLRLVEQRIRGNQP